MNDTTPRPRKNPSASRNPGGNARPGDPQRPPRVRSEDVTVPRAPRDADDPPPVRDE